MLRCIREVSPRWIVGENVRGLTNWNGGMVFDEVQADLEANGYEVLPFLLPACAVNAPHRRDRIWFIANSSSNGYDAKSTETNNSIRQDNQQSGTQWERTAEGFSYERNATNTERIRPILWDSKEKRKIQSGFKSKTLRSISKWETFPTVSPVCNGDDGFSDRLDSITFPKWRNESIKAGGNAVVPQVVYQIFKAIHTFETQNLKP
jgi:DNA (cytosine-5)-methyltransferase 1